MVKQQQQQQQQGSIQAHGYKTTRKQQECGYKRIRWQKASGYLLQYTFCNNVSHDLPILKFNTRDFVSNRNKKNRKKLVELPSLRSVALK